MGERHNVIACLQQYHTWKSFSHCTAAHSTICTSSEYFTRAEMGRRDSFSHNRGSSVFKA